MTISNPYAESLVILDAGGQYTKVIDRRIRELRVHTAILPCSTSIDEIKKYKAVIISGGPTSVTSKNAPTLPADLLDCGLPILGICWGMQFINHISGGEVQTLEKREDGVFDIDIISETSIFKGLAAQQTVLLTHGDSITKIAPEYKIVATSSGIPAAISFEEKRIFGVQFHPEVDLTENGQAMFKNFIDLAGFNCNYTESFRDEACIKQIKDQVGPDGKILVLVSGGVDSCVLAALCFKAIGQDRVKCMHIDNGFMRKGESETVVKRLNEVGIECELINGQHQFYNASCQIYGSRPDQLRQEPSSILCKTIDPEQKRKIIGDTFINLVKIESERRGMSIDKDDVFLAQGTLRPDLIESASSSVTQHADVIKTHHNDSPMARQYREAGRLVEPLKDYHKDEVRKLGVRLGLPSDIVNRHPFPGPGLAIRILCADSITNTEDDTSGPSLKMLSNYSHCLKTPHKLLERIKSSLSIAEHNQLELFTRNSKFYTTTLPIRSVGVQGDCRSYSQVACISGPPEWKNLIFLAKLIPRICHNVNRICYMIGKPMKESHFPSETTVTTLSDFALSQLRECDHIANTILHEADVSKNISQMPVILIPLHFDREPYSSKVGSCQRAIVLRPFISNDFMTGKAAIPGVHIPIDIVDKIADTIIKVPGISRVLYDLTSKPPGTTEWE